MEAWERQWVDYYEELGISPRASISVVKAAYRAMAKDFHPDKNSSDAERMKRINVAYEVLSDEVRRRRYDLAIEARSKKSEQTQTRPSQPPPSAPQAQERGPTPPPPPKAPPKPPPRPQTPPKERYSPAPSPVKSVPEKSRSSLRAWLFVGGVIIVGGLIWANYADRSPSAFSETQALETRATPLAEPTPIASTAAAPTRATPKQTSTRPIEHGVYRVGRTFTSDATTPIVTTLERIEISSDGMKVFVTYHNSGGRDMDFVCKDNSGNDHRLFMSRPEGTDMYATRNWCSNKRYLSTMFRSGETRGYWGQFNVPPDATESLTVSWGQRGTLDDLVMAELPMTPLADTAKSAQADLNDPSGGPNTQEVTAAPGVYQIHRYFDVLIGGSLDTKLAHIEVFADGRTKFTATMRNTARSPVLITCYRDNNPSVFLHDGTHLESIEVGAVNGEGKGCPQFTVEPNEEVTAWAIFQGVGDAAKPFTVEWGEGPREIDAEMAVIADIVLTPP